MGIIDDYSKSSMRIPFFKNQDSLPESVLRQSGVSGNVSSKDFFLGRWHSYIDQKILQVVDMLNTNECPLKIDGWKMFHFLSSKNCPFSGSTFIRFRVLFEEVFLKHLPRLKSPKISKSTFNDPYRYGL